LRHKLKLREQESNDALKQLKNVKDQFKFYELENERLRLENENLAGHRNPNQKIQLHMKIKEENNKLREDNIRLQ